MKKNLLLSVALALFATTTMAQSWDYLKKETPITKKGSVFAADSVKVPVYGEPYRVQDIDYNGNVIYKMKSDIVGYNSLYIPAPIIEEYKLGRRCYNAGCVTISIGAPFAFMGGILVATAGKNDAQLIAGSVFLYSGCALVGVSIPLLCFGDHMKREANWQYRLNK